MNENVLLDLQVNGTVRKVLVRPERNGDVYVLDRTSGEVLSATPFVHITSSKGVDLKTGRLIPVDAKAPRQGVVVHNICPAAPAAKDWNPSSYSPRTGLLYIPQNHLCMDHEATARQLYRRHAVCRRERGVQGGPGREPGRGDSVGSGRGEGGLGDPGEVSGLERDAGHRG